MTTEEKLRTFILTKYRSLRQFTQEIDLPYSTMTTLLKKGVNNSNVQTVIKICQALNISTDALAEGQIVPIEKTIDAELKVEDILYEAKQKLLNSNHLTIENKAASAEDVYLIISTLDTVMEIRKMQSQRLADYYKRMIKNDND